MARRANIITRATRSTAVTSAVQTMADNATHLTLVVSCPDEACEFEVLYRPLDGGAAVVVYQESVDGDAAAVLPAGSHIRTIPGHLYQYQVRLTPAAESDNVWCDAHETP